MDDPICDLPPDLLADVLALNQQYVTELSSSTAEQFERLMRAAAYVRGIGQLDAFLMAFDQSAPVQGENLDWYKARYTRFLYIDRVAVANHAQRRGLARRLYGDVISWAGQRGYPIVCCEVNVRPPNPASDALHATFGFREVAQRELSNAKRVRYLMLDIDPVAGTTP